MQVGGSVACLEGHLGWVLWCVGLEGAEINSWQIIMKIGSQVNSGHANMPLHCWGQWVRVRGAVVQVGGSVACRVACLVGLGFVEC